MPSRTRQVLGFTSVIGLLCYGVVHPAVAASGEQIQRPRPDPGTSEQDAGSLAAWEDREFRTTYVAETDETHMWLALQPVDPAANTPVLTLTFSVRFDGRSPTVTPGQLGVRATMNPLLDPRVARQPVLTFVLDADTEDETQLQLNGIFATAAYLTSPVGPVVPPGGSGSPFQTPGGIPSPSVNPADVPGPGTLARIIHQTVDRS